MSLVTLTVSGSLLSRVVGDAKRHYVATRSRPHPSVLHVVACYRLAMRVGAITAVVVAVEVDVG